MHIYGKSPVVEPFCLQFVLGWAPLRPWSTRLYSAFFKTCALKHATTHYSALHVIHQLYYMYHMQDWHYEAEREMCSVHEFAERQESPFVFLRCCYYGRRNLGRSLLESPDGKDMHMMCHRPDRYFHSSCTFLIGQNIFISRVSGRGNIHDRMFVAFLIQCQS